MAIIDYVIIAVYMVGMVGIGFLFAGKNKSSDDYLVGGRGVGTSVFMATWLATCIGGGVLNGWIGTTYANGLSLIPSVITMYVLTAIIGLFMAEKVRSFGGVTTAQILHNTYGKNHRRSPACWASSTSWGRALPCRPSPSARFCMLSRASPFVWGCIISMAIIFLYTYTAGFWGRCNDGLRPVCYHVLRHRYGGGDLLLRRRRLGRHRCFGPGRAADRP